MMQKERGLKVSLAIFAFVSLLAFGTGYLLNKALLATGF